MDVRDAIKERRSIRKYKKDDIAYEDILEILGLSIYAPNAGNIPHYYFIIVKDPEKIEKISKIADQDFIKDANTIIVIVSDDNKLKYFHGDMGKIYAIQDTAAIAQNILLLATDKNIGSCWIGKFNEDEIKKLLEIPKDYSVHLLITLGYPDEKPPKPNKPNLSEIAFFERWGNKVYKPSYYPLMSNLKQIINYIKRVFEKP
ncbi:MAG: nitroreductase family protein [Nanopusillaceae archaeon]